MCIQRLGQEFLFPIDSLTRIKFYQIENEYGNMEGSYGQKGKEYVKWAANMALGLDAGVPWVMCKQTDTPGDIIDTCNNYYCDGYKPNSPNKFGLKSGTNFGRTSGGPFYITSYDYDAPIDDYGLRSDPKWGHLKDLHAAIKLCEPALVAEDSPQYMKLGPKQERCRLGRSA
ncbi:hypothetical protein F3Y22_tig00111027pilonHSYRG00637 [Hibiscus syriacus]|uniref:beta-galactosidase n=1 Tax=Hibiscus syriacus TaxID=106335 RepID=A0A6A2Z5K7_HIBSY|nr:hypothetical protein F3Y22_tig00111027pilonHSYRG00637 [Hibiscus syriacus]